MMRLDNDKAALALARAAAEAGELFAGPDAPLQRRGICADTPAQIVYRTLLTSGKPALVAEAERLAEAHDRAAAARRWAAMTADEVRDQAHRAWENDVGGQAWESEILLAMAEAAAAACPGRADYAALVVEARAAVEEDRRLAAAARAEGEARHRAWNARLEPHRAAARAAIEAAIAAASPGVDAVFARELRGELSVDSVAAVLADGGDAAAVVGERIAARARAIAAPDGEDDQLFNSIN
jgi:hypothetical protein